MQMLTLVITMPGFIYIPEICKEFKVRGLNRTSHFSLLTIHNSLFIVH